jgi:hypothetical protein
MVFPDEHIRLAESFDSNSSATFFVAFSVPAANSLASMSMNNDKRISRLMLITDVVSQPQQFGVNPASECKRECTHNGHGDSRVE